MHNAGVAAKENAGFLDLVNLKVDQLTEAQKNNSKELSTNQDIVAKWIVEHNNGVKVNEAQAKSLRDAGLAILLYGDNIVFAKDNTIDWTKTKQSMMQEDQKLKKNSEDVWGSIKMLLDQNVISIKQADEWSKILGETGVASYDELKIKLDAYSESIENSKGPLDDILKAHQEAAKAAQEASEKLMAEADALGILGEISGLTTDEIERAIDIKKSEIKEGDKLINTLQNAARARGAELDVVKMTIPQLTEYIKTHRLEKISNDEIQGSLGELIVKKEEEVRATSLQKAVAMELLKTMKDAIPVTDMTGKGLMTLVQTYDDMSNATRLAADEVGTWFANLKLTQKVNEELAARIEVMNKNDASRKEALHSGEAVGFTFFSDFLIQSSDYTKST